MDYRGLIVIQDLERQHALTEADNRSLRQRVSSFLALHIPIADTPVSSMKLNRVSPSSKANYPASARCFSCNLLH